MKGKKSLVEEHEPKAAPPPPPRVGVLEVFSFADRFDKFLIITGCIAGFASGAGRPAFAFILGRIITDLAQAGNVESEMSTLALYLVYLGIGVAVTSIIFAVTCMVAAHRQLVRIRNSYFRAALTQDIGWHDVNKPGALVSRLVGDTRVILAGIGDKVGLGFRSLGMFISGYGFALYQSWQLTLVMVGLLPLMALSGAMMARAMQRSTDASRQFYARAAENAMEAMENIKTVQVFGREEYELGRFEQSLGEARDAGIRKEFQSGFGSGTTYFIMYNSYTILFFFGSYLLQWGDITIGEVLGSFFSVLIGSFGIGLLFPSIAAFAEARAATYTVYATINRKPTIDPTIGGKKLERGFTKAIEFRNVAFSYPTRSDETLFRSLNVTIPRGSTVAFTGPSGCGKSSIVGMIERFYDPTGGTVLVDGVNLAELDLEWWRRQIGIVSQEPVLFSGSILDNVRIGKPEATLEEAQAACRRASIHDDIMKLPDQYDTSVGTVGTQLSGGQKQRVAIARALILNPSILILDEATSALDRRSEAEVQAAIDDVMHSEGGERLTVIIVAHRLTTIRNATCIHFLRNEGEPTGSVVVEKGTFDELMAKGGEFAAMVQLQTKTANALPPGEGEDGHAPATHSATQRSKRHSDDHHKATATGEKNGEDAAAGDAGASTLEAKAKAEVEKQDVPMMRILKMNRENMWAVGLAFLGSAIAGSIYWAYALVLGAILNVFAQGVNNGPEIRNNTPEFASLFSAIAVAAFCGWTLQGFYAVAGERLTVKLRVLLFRSILRQDMTFFDTPGRDPGALSGVLSGDCEAVHQLWGPSIGFKIQLAASLIGGLIVAFVYSWRLALVTLSTMPALAIGNLLQRKAMAGLSDTVRQDETIIAESFTNIRTVAAFNLQAQRAENYAVYEEETLKRDLHNAIVGGTEFGVSQAFIFCACALTYWYGGKLISDGDNTFQDVMTCAFAIMMAGVGVGEAGSFASKLTDAKTSAKRVFALVDHVPDIDPLERGSTDLGDGCTLAFEGVAFTFPARPKAPVLLDIDVEFPNATRNGLIGQTGSGKSSMISLLARFYRPTRGEILLNSRPLNEIDLVTWREDISIVLQEPNLSSGTVRENIRYARLDATDEEVEAAAKLAHIHDEILKLPNGYETDVGYRGRSLSGGQKQRVAIARGLLRRPRLLLLDEATSALDNATEAAVQEGIMQAHREHPMTVISIAHRLTTIVGSDKIVLLDSGIVVEEGTHAELVALAGEYMRRWEAYQSASQ